MNINFSSATYMESSPNVLRYGSPYLPKVELLDTDYVVYGGSGDPVCVEEVHYDVGWFRHNPSIDHLCTTHLVRQGCVYITHTNTTYQISLGQNIHIVVCLGVSGGFSKTSFRSTDSFFPLKRVGRNLSYAFYPHYPWYAYFDGRHYNILSPQVLALGLVVDTRKKAVLGVHFHHGENFIFNTSSFVAGRGTTLVRALTSPGVMFLNDARGRPWSSRDFKIINCWGPSHLQHRQCDCSSIRGHSLNLVQLGCPADLERRLGGACLCNPMEAHDFVSSFKDQVVLDDEHVGWLARVLDVLLSLFNRLVGFIVSRLTSSKFGFVLFAISWLIFVLLPIFPNFLYALILTLIIFWYFGVTLV